MMKHLVRSWAGPNLVAVSLLLGVFAVACAEPATPAAKEVAPAAPAKAAQAASAASVAWPGTPAAIPIIGGVPDAPPRATATPMPAGAAPPPAPKPPAPRTTPLYAHVDTVTAGPGESKWNVDANLSCVKSSVFSRGMRIVWRMEVVDTSNGKILQADDVENLALKLSHGEELKFRFGRHGATEDAPWFWTAAWDVPMDYPLGVLDYRIAVATKGGKSANLDDPLVMSNPARQMDTRLVIVPANN